ncbi:hypothetical protein WNY61_03190 [Sulfitobacter sp. AS92]|uniref:hypothetical protein n=1 Tax=Sulfitobacter sp. AS92 TaxID=3135783 RepID=UPI00316BD919
MTKLVEWNGKSVSFFTKLEDVPIPLPALVSPIRLFNLAFNADGSFYTTYFGGGTELTEQDVSSGAIVFRKDKALPDGGERRFSIHGSGEIRSFLRDEEEIVRHLGYELRALSEPKLLFQHMIGGAGEYINRPLAVQKPKTNAIVIPGLFENQGRAVFSCHVAPGDYVAKSDKVIWEGITREIDGGSRLNVTVTLDMADMPTGAHLCHELRVYQNNRRA